MKGQCTDVVELLIKELLFRFPSQEVLNTMGIVFPQYWLQSSADSDFLLYLACLKKWFCEVKAVAATDEVMPDS